MVSYKSNFKYFIINLRQCPNLKNCEEMSIFTKLFNLKDLEIKFQMYKK